MTEISIPSRMPASAPVEDAILPFEVASLDLRGRVVRLGPALDRILGSHDYPQPVAKLLGEAIALTVLLGSSLKFEGRFILQTQTDGPVRMLVVDFTSDFTNPGRVRACARFDRARVEAAIAARAASAGELLGQGHLAMTIDQGTDMSRYQGLVALTGGGLEDAAHEYFLRSEQIPTRVRLAVAEEFSAATTDSKADGEPRSAFAASGIDATPGPRHRWRAGGMLLQFLPKSAERMRGPDLDPGDAPAGTAPHVVAEDDAWREGRALIETVKDIELIDPDLSSEQLLFRLFHEHGVRVFRSTGVEAKCSCSRENVANMLKSFSQDDRDHMVENGVISVTCEFCSSHYVFEPGEVAG
jgi:molecular chaperone Hsp33